jgi:hypothetical protein
MGLQPRTTTAEFAKVFANLDTATKQVSIFVWCVFLRFIMRVRSRVFHCMFFFQFLHSPRWQQGQCRDESQGNIAASLGVTRYNMTILAETVRRMSTIQHMVRRDECW